MNIEKYFEIQEEETLKYLEKIVKCFEKQEEEIKRRNNKKERIK
jgi:hypothetical protein